jgi:SOS response regulatory protein OraA/RecX
VIKLQTNWSTKTKVIKIDVTQQINSHNYYADFDFAVLSIESGDNIGRFMLQKLDDKGVEHNHIKQVTMIFSSYLYVNTSV